MRSYVCVWGGAAEPESWGAAPTRKPLGDVIIFGRHLCVLSIYYTVFLFMAADIICGVLFLGRSDLSPYMYIV